MAKQTKSYCGVFCLFTVRTVKISTSYISCQVLHTDFCLLLKPVTIDLLNKLIGAKW